MHVGSEDVTQTAQSFNQHWLMRVQFDFAS